MQFVYNTKASKKIIVPDGQIDTNKYMYKPQSTRIIVEGRAKILAISYDKLCIVFDKLKLNT